MPPPASVPKASLRPGAGRLLTWPAPALLTWLAAWLAAWSAARLIAWWPAIAELPPAAAHAVGILTAVLAALACRTYAPWRRWLTALGYPLALLASGALADWPAWCWLLPLALLLLAYPLRAWRDAPLFPTPLCALQGVAAETALPAGAHILDAGCGLGHGLKALRREWPLAHIEGIESSWPLRLACALRCRFARVHQGDMWQADWSGCAMVYLFQRPESMARAWSKAQREMAHGGWLLSLAFEVPGAVAHAVQAGRGSHPVWLYRIGAASVASIRLSSTGPASAASIRLTGIGPASAASIRPVHCR